MSNTINMYDGLANVVSGIGTSKDKRQHNHFTYTHVYSKYELEAAYLTNWLARQIIDIPVDDGCREWRSFTGEDAEVMHAAEKRLKLVSLFKAANYWARLYGGSGILMITDQPLNEPLDLSKLRKGSLKRLVTLDRNDLTPTNIHTTDPTSANYLKPDSYVITGGQALVHHSHLVIIDGEELPRLIRQANNGWGDSTLRRVIDEVKDIAATKSGIATMVQEANVDIITREGLSDELASSEDEVIINRFAQGARMKSLINTLLLDSSETFDRKSLAFAGLSQILEQFQIYAAGAADIPYTRLFGVSAAGMNATGEGDLRNYYDSVKSMQTTKFADSLEIIDTVVAISEGLSEVPEYEWNPLYQTSGIEQAQQELASTQSDDVRLQQGVIKKSTIALKLKNTGIYDISDADIEVLRRDELAEEQGMFSDLSQ